MHYLMAVTSMKSTHREVDEIDFSIYVRKTGKWQIKCFEYITCHKNMYEFCTVFRHCDWLSYPRDQLRISQSTNTWIKESTIMLCITFICYKINAYIKFAVSSCLFLSVKKSPFLVTLQEKWHFGCCLWLRSRIRAHNKRSEAARGPVSQCKLKSPRTCVWTGQYFSSKLTGSYLLFAVSAHGKGKEGQKSKDL